MKHLIEKELALHQFDIRCNAAKVAEFLHADFKEVGRSGTTFDCTSIVESMKKGSPDELIHAQDFECFELEQNCYLLVYKTALIDSDRNVGNFAKRSSIWVNSGERWKLRYHQGTPCGAFQLNKSAK